MCHVQSLEKDFYLDTPSSFDHDFSHITFVNNYIPWIFNLILNFKN
jgi:hypothetical protein